ncbi:substrate-binding domain-containing protein [Nonomuraea sp. M3C6]|uniref:Substrate-binding domain-containing protein n=1 Tax=Nonomuraea marmarensis TaxID=3351344 RepID=A0ABW7AI11_9ACTN
MTTLSRLRRAVTLAVPIAMSALLATACTTADSTTPPNSSVAATTSDAAPGELAASGKVTKTVGPNGATGVPMSDLQLTADDIAKLKAGNYSAALLLQTTSDWSNAVTEGAKKRLAELGISLSATSNSNYSAADQANAVKTVLAKKPSAILTWPINPQELAPSLRQATAAGVKLAFISNLPTGFKHGSDYVGVVGDDLYGMGKVVADQLSEAIGGSGDIGFLYFNANAYVVNQRDAAFRTAIEQDHPNIKIVAKQGFSDPSQAFQMASAMLLQNPSIKAIYAPWAEPAAGVVQAIGSSRRNDVYVGTMDLSNTVALSLAQNGAVRGLVIDNPYGIGQAMATEIGMALLGKEVPAYVQVPAVPITRENLLQGYRDYYSATPPKQVVDAVAK